MRRRHRIVPALFLFLVTAIPSSLTAQARTGLLLGGTFDAYGFGEGLGAFVPTFRVTHLAGTGPGVDAALGVLPHGLSEGTLVMALDAGLAQGLGLGPATLLLKAGVSNLLAVGQTSFLFPGLQGGAGLILPVDRRGGLRMELTRHWYLAHGTVAPLWSAGLGFVVFPPGRHDLRR